MGAWTVFHGEHGLRSGWRFLRFLVVFDVLVGVVGWAVTRSWQPPEGAVWTAGILIASEAWQYLCALSAVALSARLEKKTFADFFHPWRRVLGSRFLEGAAWGALSNAATVAMIAAAGGYTVSGLALAPAEALRMGLAWAAAFLLVSLFEELLFRGYPLATLAEGMGFWPAAFSLSVLFGALHYFAKPGETWIDGLAVSLIGLFLCASVRYTGDLALAIGWHFTWNFTSMFVFGSPNTGNGGRPVAGHLLASSFHGPEWLTGGGMGVEASAFAFVTIAALFAALPLRFRRPSSDGRLVDDAGAQLAREESAARRRL